MNHVRHDQTSDTKRRQAAFGPELSVLYFIYFGSLPEDVCTLSTNRRVTRAPLPSTSCFTFIVWNQFHLHLSLHHPCSCLYYYLAYVLFVKRAFQNCVLQLYLWRVRNPSDARFAALEDRGKTSE
jgi:hypothetical protein